MLHGQFNYKGGSRKVQGNQQQLGSWLKINFFQRFFFSAEPPKSSLPRGQLQKCKSIHGDSMSIPRTLNHEKRARKQCLHNARSRHTPIKDFIYNHQLFLSLNE